MQLSRSTARSVAPIGGLLALLIAACSTSGTAADPAPTTPTIAITQATTLTNTTARTTTTASTTSTTMEPTTTLSPAAVYVSEVCAVLSEVGFETRRAVLGELPDAFADAGGVGDVRDAVAAQCAAALERLEAAVAIRDRIEQATTASEGSPPVEVTDFQCDGGNVSVDVTNLTETAVGIHVAFAIYDAEDRADPIQSSYAPIVIWSLEPGATETVAGLFADIGGRALYCEVNGDIFDADPSDVDAALDVAMHPELTGDDPAAWLPALLAVERGAAGTGDADVAAAIADIRSVSYLDVLERILDTTVDPGDASAVGEIEICERGRTQPDPDRISLVYREVWDGGSQLRHGLFRRGLDGQWRWLSTARYFESSILDDCAFVDFRPGEFVVDS